MRSLGIERFDLLIRGLFRANLPKYIFGHLIMQLGPTPPRRDIEHSQLKFSQSAEEAGADAEPRINGGPAIPKEIASNCRSNFGVAN
jgi:hypothetical protein